ncbi:hypothetical protein J4711_14560 [Staphylococcus epidermidis]|nr:hypothetical protein [Staphylococcus epidermidis]
MMSMKDIKNNKENPTMQTDSGQLGCHRATHRAT